MMKYKAILYQSNDWDYTIGCGVQVIDIEASSGQEASEILFKLISEEYSYERIVDTVTLVEVTESWDINMSSWYDAIDKIAQAEEAKEISDREFEEYQRLKEKFKK